VCVPAGVDQCITIAAQAKVPGLNPEQDMADFIDLLNAGMAANASVDNHHTSEHLKLHRIISKELYLGWHFDPDTRLPSQPASQSSNCAVIFSGP
jgi:hypothetical protein